MPGGKGPEYRDPASFRDREGYVFAKEGTYYRRVLRAGADNYHALMTGGLYDALTKRGLLLTHEERPELANEAGEMVIRPQQLSVITYPFEWSFSQLKDAAHLTLQVQTLALQHGMTLKDASAYNVQFWEGRPVFIDTLSFEAYEEGTPWQPYRQFCQHFLAPLALMAYTDVSLGQLLRVYIDGVPLPLASKLLPPRAKMKFGIATHVLAQAAAQAHVKQPGQGEARLGLTGLRAIIDSLDRTAAKLTWKPRGTTWADYYDQTNYVQAAMKEKMRLVAALVQPLQPRRVLDLGSNNGFFSRVIAEATGALVISPDFDPAAVDQNYDMVKRYGERQILPLLLDLSNPQGGFGWGEKERGGALERLTHAVDVTVVLALVHHLVIANNVPWDSLAQELARTAPQVLVEFVPKSDSQVQRLLASRKDIFDDYTVEAFEAAFGRYFRVKKRQPIVSSERVLYLFERR